MKWKIGLVMLVLVFAGRGMAQEICPALVRAAVETASRSCGALGRNQACYGNVLLEVEAQPDAPPLTFEQAGDIADLGHIARLSLSPMNTQTETWGMAVLRAQADLPETSPGQNVAMILFGEVEMTDAAPPIPEAEPEPEPVLLDVTAGGNINVRGGPSTNDAVVASLSASTTVTADGRNADGSWLRVQLADGSLGWVFAQLVRVDGDASTLAVVDASTPPVVSEPVPEVPTYTPMQAFYFTSAIGDSPCAEAPDSGILIQTPRGEVRINLLVNGVEIVLGSTAYLQAQPGGEMTINVIEGQGVVSAFDRRVTVPAGARARVPLDDDGAASGEPIGPEPYDEAAFNALPLLLLPDAITIAPALTDEEISSLGPGLPLAGEWTAQVQTDWVCDNAETLGTNTFVLSNDAAGGFTIVSAGPIDPAYNARTLFERLLDYLRDNPDNLVTGESFVVPPGYRVETATSTLIILTAESILSNNACDITTITMRFTGDDSQESATPGLAVGEWTAVADVDWNCTAPQILETYTFILRNEPADNEYSFFDIVSSDQNPSSMLSHDAELALVEVMDYLIDPSAGVLGEGILSITELTIESSEAVSAVVDMGCDTFVAITMRFTGG